MAETTEGTITVQAPDRVFRRVAMRLNGGGQHVTLVGELGDVRAYVRERDGKTTIILTKEDLYE